MDIFNSGDAVSVGDVPGNLHVNKQMWHISIPSGNSSVANGALCCPRTGRLYECIYISLYPALSKLFAVHLDQGL